MQQIKDYPSSNYNEPIDILTAVRSSPQVEAYINSIQKHFHTIDITEAINIVGTFESVIKLTYAGSKGLPWQHIIMKILADFQSLVKNACVEVSNFVEGSLTVLKYHQKAITLAEKDKLETAIGLINGRCSTFVSSMVDRSIELFKTANAFYENSKNLLKTEQINQSPIIQEEKQIKEKILFWKVQLASLEKKIKSLEKNIKDLKIIQEEFEKKLDNKKHDDKKHDEAIQQSRSVDLNTKFPVKNDNPSSVNDISNSSSEGKVFLQKRISEIKELIEKLIISETYLTFQKATSYKELLSLGEKKNEIKPLVEAVMYIDLIMQGLEKLKGIFEVYWAEVKNNSEKMKDHGILNAYADDKAECINHLKESGFNWLALGSINYKAFESIKKVDVATDELMNNLPTKEEEANEIVKNERDAIIDAFKNSVSINSN